MEDRQVLEDKRLLEMQRARLATVIKGNQEFKPIEPPMFTSKEEALIGEKIFLKGEVGVLLLAGGMGSRLGLPVPKALFPLSCKTDKSLLQIFCERVVAASNYTEKKLSLAVMLSRCNSERCLRNLKENRLFGMPSSHLHTFHQGMLPFITKEGEWIYDESGKRVEGPDGNGNFLQTFYASGIYKQFKEAGVKYISVVPIDNGLIDPFHVGMIGRHVKQGSDITLMTFAVENGPVEMGSLVIQKENLVVKEYSEFKANASLYPWKNGGHYIFSMDFIEKNHERTLPYHLAWKKAWGEKMAWKFETFIFDWIEYTSKVSLLREEMTDVFAPLKAMDTIEAARSALLENERKRFEKRTGKRAPNKSFELDPSLYYPSNMITIDKV